VVVSRIKGGLSVDIGLRAFLPGSQIDLKPVKNLENLIGQTLECRIVKINRKRSNIVISRKAVLEERLSLQKEQTLEQLYEGAVVQGTVKNITDYGVFVDLGGIDGLLHVSDVSWGRVYHPSRSFVIGAEVQVKVLKLDKEKERVSLGYKQLTGDPWGTALNRYPVGSRVQGRVVSLADYGAFVELEEGIEGLVHVSEMTWNRRLKSVSKILSMGDAVEVVVLEINPVERRLSLGMKQVEDDPWKTLPERYSVGQVVRGMVRNLADFGAFIEVEEGIDGLVHISDLSATRRIKHPSEVLRKGEQVEAVVLNIDSENHRISLGLHQLQSEVKPPEAVLKVDTSQPGAPVPSAMAARATAQNNFTPRETQQDRQNVSDKDKPS
jgi:small subunit ribosomal protein S1